ncbi:Nucleoporin [Podosphaera aphanis]|nr:Nucleoporin [Podosphaera aphanis]
MPKYLPPLDKWLKEEDVTISWKSVYSAISSNDDTQKECKTVEIFLKDQDAAKALSKPFDAFPPPSAQSKATFETKTSAINTTPSLSARYDVNEIKEDALWLSKKAHLDEVVALRLAVVESQCRSAALLLGPLSEEELSSLREAAGNEKYTNTISLSQFPQGLQPEQIQEEFEELNARRKRILKTYFSERRYLWKCAEQVLHHFFCKASSDVEENPSNENVLTSWLDERAQANVASLKSIDIDALILLYIDSICTNIQDVTGEKDFLKEDASREELETDWIFTQITVATHGMEIIWHILSYTLEAPSSQVVLKWFQLLQSCDFFHQFGLGNPYYETIVQPLQALAALISIALINNIYSLALLQDLDSIDEVSSDLSDDKPFILNPKNIKSLHTIILQAAKLGLASAGPTVLAWSILLQTITLRVEAERKAMLIENDKSDTPSPIENDNSDSILIENDNCNSPGQDDANNSLRQISSPYEEVLEDIQASLEEEVIDFLALQAVNNFQVFELISAMSLRLGNTSEAFFSNIVGCQMRNTILDLLKMSVGVGYITELIEATLLTITGGRGYWDVVNSEAIPYIEDPVAKFLGDDSLVEFFLKISQSRYPYESLPFLRFVRALATSTFSHGSGQSFSVLNFLEAVPMFTLTLPIEFVDYETTQEQENNNTVRLKRSINLFEPRNKNITNNFSGSMSVVRVDPDFVIPAGTIGRIVSDNGPKVACWFHTYSALKYFGKLLETYLAASDQVDGTTGMSADSESVSEIIEILALLIQGITCSANSNIDSMDYANQVLEATSSGLNRNRDIITVIFDILEEELQCKSCCSGLDVPLQILVSCIHFVHAILPLAPHRVWPQLARSGIMGATRGGERLSIIVEGVEVLSGRFDFLISCSLLFESLLEDIAVNALRRKSGRKSSASFNGAQNVETGSPDQCVAKFLLSFTKYLVDVHEKSCTWKFQPDDDRRRLGRIITSAFDKVLFYSFGIEYSTDAFSITDRVKQIKPKTQSSFSKETQPLLGILMPSACYLVENFLSTSSGNLKFQSLLRSFLDGFENPYSTLYSYQLKRWSESVVTSILFSKTLLRVRILLSRPASRLEKLLFNSLPLIARLFSSDDSYQIPTITLIENLVLAATSHGSDPPSLLGFLGPMTSRNFMQVLSNLDQPLSRPKTIASIWHFLGTIVSSRQQWFSNYLLTGKTPREALKAKPVEKEAKLKGKIKPQAQTLLTTALKILINMSDDSISESLAVLEFVALAQNFWPWTLFNETKYQDFIKSILDYVGNLIPPQVWQGNITESLNACTQSKVAAYVAEILAVHLFHSRQSGTSIPLENLLPNLSYYERFGASVPHYNASLHTLLKQNFETRYPGCNVQDFKRTSLEDQFSESDYFFDLRIADKMLSCDRAWAGRSGSDGMRAEFERANINLSLVDAHIALFQSWKLLSLELSSRISTEPGLNKMFSRLVSNCLLANCKAQPPEEIFSRLSQTRVDFALVLTQRLAENKSSSAGSSELLKVVWTTICELRGNFERSVADNDVLYYRTLLKILFLTVRLHSTAQLEQDGNLNKSVCFSQLPSIIPTVVEIIKYVVSRGLREIVTSIHESVIDSSPDDLALITGILQSCLRVPSIAASHSQIVSILLSDGTPNIAMRLYTWSDRLAVDGDPIYGELSILFLLELSSITIMAEQLALDGVLTQIATAGITSYLRNEGVGPLANNPGSRRCYSIWARGILPLLLNLLDSVQRSIAIEVAQFLNLFPNLLQQSEEIIEAPHMTRLPELGSKKQITLIACSEVHSMALIIFILNSFRKNLAGTPEIPEVKWDPGTTLENVEFWLGNRAILRERLFPIGERELEIIKKRDYNNATSCELEESVVTEMMGIREVLKVSEI